VSTELENIQGNKKSKEIRLDKQQTFEFLSGKLSFRDSGNVIMYLSLAKITLSIESN
jgi:hypothetical protein